MELATYFTEFLSNIRPTQKQRETMGREHNLLKQRLENDPVLKKIVVAIFIQGSYRRHTGLIGDRDYPCDVDLVVVTNLDHRTVTPAQALEMFRPFLEEHYKGKYEQQDRSWCITVADDVKLDLVLTSAPSQASRAILETVARESARFFDGSPPSPFALSESADSILPILEKAAGSPESWQRDPLMIPDREVKRWSRTHPLLQIMWALQKNRACNGHYLGVVRSIKWWRRDQRPTPKYPKGYPLEHLVGLCCPDGIKSVAEGIAITLGNIVSQYGAEAAGRRCPRLPDHGVPEHDVFKRVDGGDFAGFYAHVREAADAARRALEVRENDASAGHWRGLLGPKFPGPAAGVVVKEGGFTPRTAKTEISSGRYA